MASPSVKLLDGPGGYLRWKESMLLRAHTLGVARVLVEEPPTGCDGAEAEAAAKKWARDDAICRGHILATLSDRLLPDYARFTTAGELWRALERTYDVETPHVWESKFDEFTFDKGRDFLEQLAHAEALGVAEWLSDGTISYDLSRKLPEVVRNAAVAHPDLSKKGMSLVWEIARNAVSGLEPELLWKITEDDIEDEKQKRLCWTCHMPGHIAKNCSIVEPNARKCRRMA